MRHVGTIHLPMSLEAAARLMQGFTEAFPTARLGDSGDPAVVWVVVDDDEEALH